MQRNKVLGIGRPAGTPRWHVPPKLEDLRDSIARKVEAIILARALEPGAVEARERDWAKRRGGGEAGG